MQLFLISPSFKSRGKNEGNIFLFLRGWVRPLDQISSVSNKADLSHSLDSWLLPKYDV